MNIVSNALFRLVNSEISKFSFGYDKLKTLLNEMNYIIIIVKMNVDFRKSIFQNYENNS